ncbi:MAG: Eco57I restriction-modification methylase domain-containing protein [Deltaproteobacteria bacterium]|nr:Eco57I restriction-modification methylase domain-containing protein [Deltaproteobacteria bacterium]
MGSGHFLVTLVDFLADRVIGAMAEAEAAVEGYVSPLASRIQTIRERIVANAEERNWAIDRDRLDDRHIVRRMVLKRCVYGVDKNPMAVELAKVALWLQTFTVGAPLSFLDHHLRCGDSLFGAWARSGIDKATEYGSPLLLHGSVTEAKRAAQSMQTIEGLTDAEIAEAHRSAEAFAEVEEATAPLNAVLSLVHALDWLEVKDRKGKTALQAFFTGQLGDPIVITAGDAAPERPKPKSESGGITRQISPEEAFEAYSNIAKRAGTLIENERFFHWQTAFPGVWMNWESEDPEGGFDAVIGNPPWDRMKLQQVEWFATRRREIALATRAADRKRMIAALERDGDALAQDYAVANGRAAMAAGMARRSGDYPLLSAGDVNVYSLFVERAMTLVKPDGMVGLLTPSGIASDKTAARFFKGVATQGRLKALYDFENKKVFFPDVHASFKFCVFVASPSPIGGDAACAFYLHNVAELGDAERRFPLTAEALARVNPNTGTAPIFRTRRDASLTTAIYERLPVLVDRSTGEEVKAWPVTYTRMRTFGARALT